MSHHKNTTHTGPPEPARPEVHYIGQKLILKKERRRWSGWPHRENTLGVRGIMGEKNKGHISHGENCGKQEEGYMTEL